MYLHLGMNVYLWSERITAIFDASYFQTATETADPELMNLPKNLKLVRHGLSLSEVKSFLLTAEDELHWSKINCRTLRKRWNERCK